MQDIADMSADEFRKLGYKAVDLIAATLARRQRRQEMVRPPVPEQLRQHLVDQPLPEDGTEATQLLDEVAENIFPYPLGHNNPRFFAWINSPALPISIIGELLAAGMNTSAAGGDQASTYLEHGVLKWFIDLMGFPADSGGLLLSGGSMATIVGLAVMRHVKTQGSVRSRGLHQGRAQMTIYVSAEGHSCIQKAVELLGFGNASIREIDVDASYRMDITDLAAKIQADRVAGHRPVCVVASAGTVNTGAIDPFNAIADLCAREDMWLHIDGAYGAVGKLVASVAPHFAGLERADSLGMDPHKWMYIPVECGLVLVRNKKAMHDCFSLVPEYLRDDRRLPWFAEFGPQQTRAFRALKLWLAIRQLGLSGYRQLIQRDLDLAHLLRRKLEQAADFKVVTTSPLSITCFLYAPAGAADLDALNRALLDLIQAEGKVYLTHTTVDEQLVLRACLVNFRTDESDLDFLLSAIRTAGQRCL